ncbi:MAG: hypothetical protein Q9227_005125 [Pyrenula ochraceoflavens]
MSAPFRPRKTHSDSAGHSSAQVDNPPQSYRAYSAPIPSIADQSELDRNDSEEERWLPRVSESFDDAVLLVDRRETFEKSAQRSSSVPQPSNENLEWSEHSQNEHLARSKSLRLSNILAHHIRYLGDNHANLEDAELWRVYQGSAYNELCRYGYDIQDVELWAWLLSYESATVAAQKLALIGSQTKPQKLPFFLILYFLSLPHLEAQSLRILVDTIEHQITRNGPSCNTSVNKILIDVELLRISPDLKLLLIDRLLRQSALHWPIGFERIANVMCELFPPTELASEKNKYARSLSQNYNRVLCWLARPVALQPMRSRRFQQEAQSCLLRRMTQFKPHLPVNREAFKALTSVQLAHKKTKTEKEWASLKSRSWPPWRANKSGIDESRGDEGSVSRASNIMQQMVEAGYGIQKWEEKARVFTGWDTDGSPTIQTRKLLQPPKTSGLIVSSSQGLRSHWSQLQQLWAARIESTRTVREAWSAFQSYEQHMHRHGMNHSHEPYNAMRKRLIYRVRPEAERSSDLVGGDAKETLPEPVSPREITYVRTPAPDLNEFTETIFARKLKPHVTLLVSVLTVTDQFEVGNRFLGLRYPRIFGEPFTPKTEPERSVRFMKWLFSLSSRPRFLAAYFTFLSRFPENVPSSIHGHLFDSSIFMSLENGSSNVLKSSSPKRDENLIYVMNLMFTVLQQLQVSYAPAWYGLYHLYYQLFFYKSKYKIAIWQIAPKAWPYLENILEAMSKANVPMNPVTFEKLLQYWEPFALREFESFCGPIHIAPKAVKACKHYFRKTYPGLDMPNPFGQKTPAHAADLLWIPSYHALHSMIRIFGIGLDHDAILSLLRWMRTYSEELNHNISDGPMGRSMERRTIVAIRVFLECLWVNDGSRGTMLGFDSPRAFVAEAKKLILEVEAWKGWPTDDEVASYIESDGKDLLRVSEHALGVHKGFGYTHPFRRCDGEKEI